MKTDCKILATLEALPEFEVNLLPLITDVDEETRDTLRLVIQELGTNIVRHAYDGITGIIEATFQRDGVQLQLEFRDYALNTFTLPQKIELPDPESFPNGGWGLYLIHKGVDKVIYEHLSDGNYWQLLKTLA